MRVFAGLWPTSPVREHLAASLVTALGVDAESAPGRSGPDGVRWTAAENWHVTVAFYGDVGEGRVELLSESLEAVAAASRPFGLRLAGAGVFARRTLWAGVAGDLADVHRLVDACRAAGASLGTRPDERVRSRPHVTLGRVAVPPDARRRGRDRGGDREHGRAGVPGPGPGDALVHALAVYRGPVWDVAELVLAESRPGEGRAGGPRYRSVARWPLGG